MGSETIKDTNILLTIYDKDNKIIANLSDSQQDIKQYDRVEKIFDWPTGNNPFGFYTTLMNLTYDSIKDSKSINFRIGDILIDITNITGTTIKTGKIGKVSIKSESQYNDNINNVYAQIEADNKIWKSSTINFVPFGVNDLEIFLDTQDIKTGVYDAKAKLFYADKISEKDFKLTVKKNFFQNSALLYISLIAVLIIIVIVAYVLKNKKKDVLISNNKK